MLEFAYCRPLHGEMRFQSKGIGLICSGNIAAGYGTWPGFGKSLCRFDPIPELI